MSHNATGTQQQPASMPHDLSLVRGSADSGNGEQRVETGAKPRSLTTDLIGATLPQSKKLETVKEEEKMEQEKKKDQKEAATTSTGISSEKMDEVLKSIQQQDEPFDLQKIRDKIDAKKISAHEELKKTLRALANINRDHYPEPQYVVYANDVIEELQFYIEL